MSPAGPAPRRRRPWARRLLGLLLLLATVAGAAEMLLRRGAAGSPPLFTEHAPGRLSIAPAWPGFRPLDVAAEPPRLRLVWMGASTEAGFPFGAEAAPAAWLERILRWRGIDAEVLCVARPGLVAEETAAILDDVLGLRPRAVIVGLGHNEYARTDVLLARWWERLELVRRLGVLTGLHAVADRVPTLAEDFDHAAVAGALRAAVDGMQRQADAAGVALLVTVPVSNLADCPPVLGDDPRLPEAPDAAFDRGTRLRAAGDAAGARAAFEQARDTDRWPHRATTRLRAAILSGARQPVRVDLAFDAAAPLGLPGDELLVDHCHPGLEGMLLQAVTLADALQDLGLLPDTGRRGQAPPLAELAAQAGHAPGEESRQRAAVARAFVLFALHTGHHGRMAEMAAARLDAARAGQFRPGEAETMRALLDLLAGDAPRAAARLAEAQRQAPSSRALLERFRDEYPSVRAALERHGLGIDGRPSRTP